MGSIPVGISGSRAAAVLGMSPWATPFSVYQDIMEIRQPGFNAAKKYDYTPFEGNTATRWGLAFEDAIIKLAEAKVNGIIQGREVSYKANDYVTCHVDGDYIPMGFIADVPHTLHEGKTTTAFGFGDNWGEPGSDRIPIEYQIQVQHQMLCTGADSCIVSVLVFPMRPEAWEEIGWEIEYYEGNKLISNHYALVKKDSNEADPDILNWATILDQMGFFHQYTVPSNPDVQALMLEKYKKWWTAHIIGETPPEPQDYADIRRLITAPCGTIIVDPDTARWFKEYKDIGSEIGKSGNLSKRRDQLKVLILENARHVEATLDDESTDKWIFRDNRGKKVGSYSRTATGSMVFR